MSLNTEIWERTIKEDFWPDNSFISRSVDHSEYVDNHTVHVPQSGVAPIVTKNRDEFPAVVRKRADSELTYGLDIYDVPPIMIPKLEDVELSYDKRASVLRQSKEALKNCVAMDTLQKWVPSGATAHATTGEGEAAHVHTTATGNRKKMTRGDVEAIKKIFDAQDVPWNGRYILLDAIMYNQLVNSLTDAENVSFLSGADNDNGVIGRFLGFEFLMRSSVLTTTAGGALKTGAASAADCAGGLAWQRDCVSRALGEVKVFEKDNDPSYYGDVISYAVRAGGSHLRSDKKGIVLLYQGTPA